MIENETKANSIEEQKRKIRQRYKGISSDELDIIPATPKINFYDDEREKRVAVYARVSTDDPHQTSSYELQKNHYTDTIGRHTGWNLKEIYADEGISGTSLQHRDAFIRMIADCKAGLIDLIVTKSVSRFARNILDCIGYVRALAAMNPPIEVFFETEGIHTLSKDSEMQLSFLATLAQEESHNKSEIMNASIEMRFARGIFLTPVLLGYDHDEEGQLIINEQESLTVKLIFFMYLYGNTCNQIADTLTELKRCTKKGNITWSASSIQQILQNERYCGDVLAHKTFTPNYLDHKSKRNNRDRNQYLQKNHHDAIITREDFNAVQKILKNAKYGHTGFLPELKVIHEGSLKGYILINPRWSGFHAIDYYDATTSILSDSFEPPTEGNASNGDFDLRGFEVARGQFFTNRERITVTFTDKSLKFSKTAMDKMPVKNVELLVHPYANSFAVRVATSESKNSVQWATAKESIYYPKPIGGLAFLPTLFELFEWKTDCKYRLTGIRHQNTDGTILIFNLDDTEIFLPNIHKEEIAPIESSASNMEPIKSKGEIVAYPVSWASSFGDSYYSQQFSHESIAFDDDAEWNINSTGQAFKSEENENITQPHELTKHISTIIDTMKSEVTYPSEHNDK